VNITENKLSKQKLTIEYQTQSFRPVVAPYNLGNAIYKQKIMLLKNMLTQRSTKKKTRRQDHKHKSFSQSWQCFFMKEKKIIQRQ
jgi:hypothetical protein